VRVLSRRPRRTLTVAAVGGLAVAALLSGGGADAATSSVVWSRAVSYGTVTSIDDGDSVVVKVDGDSSSVAPVHIRNAGIQTMETGTCHAAQATTAMTGLAKGKRVRLSIANPAASSLGRPVRYVDAWNGSAWADTQLPLLRAGHALTMPGAGGDTSRWRSYEVAGQEAAKARTNLWDNEFCGYGPSQPTPLKVWVNWDGNLDEARYPNQEWVRILNTSATTLSLRGWSLRTGAQDSFFFPSGAVVPAKSTATVYVGTGTATTTTFYWGQTKPKFPNTTGSTRGSGAYLYDAQGDVRAWSMYPCVYACSDPLAGTVRMTVRADAPGTDATNLNGEYATFAPAGSSTVDLSYKVATAFGHTYEFPKGSYVKPGEFLVLRIGKGTSTRLTRYWGNTAPVLANGGGTVVLRTPENVRLACKAWGTGRC